METGAVNMDSKLRQFDELWSPRIIAEVNGQHLKLAKIKGAYIWHQHEESDELFYVLEGSMTIDFRQGSVPLGQGDLLVIPRGIEHRPHADETCSILMIEAAGTASTGDAEPNERTSTGEWI